MTWAFRRVRRVPVASTPVAGGLRRQPWGSKGSRVAKSVADASGAVTGGVVVVVVAGAVDGVVGCVAAGVAVLPLLEHADRPRPTTTESARITGRPITDPGYPRVPALRSGRTCHPVPA